MNREITGTTALVTDIERRKALPIFRALGKAGVRVIGLSYVRRPLCQYSKHCNTVYLCPDYRLQPMEFLEYFHDICAKERPDVLYPLEDQLLELLAQNPEVWRDLTSALIPDKDDLDNAYDKWKTIQMAKQLAVPVPESYCPESKAELNEIIARNPGRQWVVKPRKSSGSRGLGIAPDTSDLAALYEQVSATFERPIVQERVPQGGEGVGAFFLLNSNLETLAQFGHRRLREYPLTGGPSTLRESYRNDKLLSQSEALVRAMRCVGVSMVEYKYDANRADYVLMEINPRFWGSLALAIHAGVNFPLLYHMASLGLTFPPIMDFDLDVYCRWLWPGDILHFLQNPNRFSLQPSFFQFTGHNLTYDILSKDDPWPTFGIFIEAVRKLYKNDS